MVDETKKCPSCAEEIKAEAKICHFCGAKVPSETTATGAVPQPAAPATAIPPPTPSPAAGAPAYGAPGPLPPMAAHTKPDGGGRRGGKAVLFTLLGLLALGTVVVLLLGFVVGPKWFSKKQMTGPEKVVDTFLEAMGNQDFDLLASTMEPTSMKMKQDQLHIPLEEYVSRVSFSKYSAFKVEVVRYKTTMHGDNAANVEILGCRLAILGEYGNQTTGGLEEVDTPHVFSMVREGGKWYINFNEWFNWWEGRIP